MASTERSDGKPDYLADMRRRHKKQDRELYVALAAAAILGIGGVTALNLIFG